MTSQTKSNIPLYGLAFVVASCLVGDRISTAISISELKTTVVFIREAQTKTDVKIDKILDEKRCVVTAYSHKDSTNLANLLRK